MSDGASCGDVMSLAYGRMLDAPMVAPGFN